MSSICPGQRKPDHPEPHPEIPQPSQLFLNTDHARYYAQYRPHYPPQLYAHLYANAFPGRQPPFPDLTVLDVASGSGQALGPMPADFGSCIALDVSEAQLSELPSDVRQRVRVQVGDAHATGLPASSVDLVTVGQALHWFRLQDFYLECRRLLKPSGALAAWTYDFGQLQGFEGAQQLYEQLHSDVLAPYWAEGRELVDRYYVGIEPGADHFEEVRRLQLPMPVVSMSTDDLAGHVRSWSGHRAFLRAQPSAPEPAEWLRQQCTARMAAEGVERLTLQRTITLLLALRPITRVV